MRKTKLGVPGILVVHLVPPDQQNWVLHSEDEMAVRQCSYWLSQKGMPETTNVESVTVQIPKPNVFNPAAILEVMERLEKGELRRGN